ncbi:hypothetical protein [Streptomyces sp. NPDC055013]
MPTHVHDHADGTWFHLSVDAFHAMRGGCPSTRPARHAHTATYGDWKYFTFTR